MINAHVPTRITDSSLEAPSGICMNIPPTEAVLNFHDPIQNGAGFCQARH